MRLRIIPSVLIAASMVTATFAAAAPAIAKKKGGPVVVAKDGTGDWDDGVGAGAEVGAATGQDLIEASIEPSGKNLNFIIKVTALPPTGGTPEAVRYVWDILVDGELYELDGKFTNYSRGICDPTAGTCPPPRDPGMQPFLIRTNCGPNATVSNLVTCEEAALVHATFDAAAGTITIPVPMAAIEAKPGSKITAGTNTVGGTISASPAAFVSTANIPVFDTMVMTKTYVVGK